MQENYAAHYRRRADADGVTTFMQPVREIAANFAEMPLVKATPFWQPVLVVMPLAATLLGARRFGLGAHQSICEGLAPRTAGERNTDLPAAERD